MSADSERLTPTYDERGFIWMPAIAGRNPGERVAIHESSLATEATIWMDVPGTSIELTLDKAAGLRDQLDVLIRQHRLAVVEADTVEDPALAMTWRPLRVNADGMLLAIIDEHGERLSIQPDPCPNCGQASLFKGPTRTLCASCGRST